jgi:hypothetical protein
MSVWKPGKNELGEWQKKSAVEKGGGDDNDDDDSDSDWDLDLDLDLDWDWDWDLDWDGEISCAVHQDSKCGSSVGGGRGEDGGGGVGDGVKGRRF